MGSKSSSLEDLVVLKKKALIFDLDGTLVDSCVQIGSAVNKARTEFGHLELSPEKIKRLIGLPINHFLSDLEISESELTQIILRFREILEVMIVNSNLVFPGVSGFLQEAKSMGLKMAIATSKPTYLAELVVVNSQLVGLFDVIQGTEGFPPKPDPTCILRAMDRLDTNRAIMVGDRAEDIYAANAAKIDSIGIAQSFHEPKTLIEAGARLAFETFLDFANSKELMPLLID